MVGHVAVRVPVVRRARVDQFDEADAALRQPARHQALPAEGLGDRFGEAVEILRLGAFALHVEGLRRLFLHMESRLERFDPSRQSGIRFALAQVPAVKEIDETQLHLLDLG